jgi:hypothetical protein
VIPFGDQLIRLGNVGWLVLGLVEPVRAIIVGWLDARRQVEDRTSEGVFDAVDRSIFPVDVDPGVFGEVEAENNGVFGRKGGDEEGGSLKESST